VLNAYIFKSNIWGESLKIDVVIPTRSRNHIRSELLKALSNNFFVNKIIITEEKPLSIARKNACLKASTEWVAMFDDDVIIPQNYFQEILKHINDDVGAISSVTEPVDPHLRAYQTVISKFFPLQKIDTAPHINNVLIRKNVMKNYNPPPLFLSEDLFLREHVESLGYKWKVIGNIGVIHVGKRKSGVEIGAAYRRYAHYNLYQLSRRFLARLIFAPFAVFFSRKLTTAFILWKENVEFFAGWLKG
jgi:glycosyltransferase involved in cell wall biosynthesis